MKIKITTNYKITINTKSKQTKTTINVQNHNKHRKSQ